MLNDHQIVDSSFTATINAPMALRRSKFRCRCLCWVLRSAAPTSAWWLELPGTVAPRTVARSVMAERT
jgi:hypothetical protein